MHHEFNFNIKKNKKKRIQKTSLYITNFYFLVVKIGVKFNFIFIPIPV